MQVTKFLPIPLIVAALAFLWMVLVNQFPLISNVGWVAFLTWGGFFLAGVSSRNAIREAISFTLGIIVAIAIVMLATSLGPSLGTLTLPILVAVAAFVIVFLELVPWFDMAPGYFIGAAALFAALALPGTGPDVATAVKVLVPGLLGLGLGVLSAYLRQMVFKMEGVTDPHTKPAQASEAPTQPAVATEQQAG